MSFGFSVGDFVLLTQLAKNTIHNAQKACGAHDELVREVKSLHIVLRRTEAEVSNANSILNREDDDRRAELGSLAGHCKKVLKVLCVVLEKYNALSQEKRSVTKLWKQIKFGNGEMRDLDHIRSELVTHTQAFTIFLNLLSIGSQGKVEEYMESQGKELRDIKLSMNWVTASLQSRRKEESILTTYAEDDKETWKCFRRELIKEGFTHTALKENMETIKQFVTELGERGALDGLAPKLDCANSRILSIPRGKTSIGKKSIDKCAAKLAFRLDQVLKANGGLTSIDGESQPHSVLADKSASQQHAPEPWEHMQAETHAMTRIGQLAQDKTTRDVASTATWGSCIGTNDILLRDFEFLLSEFSEYITHTEEFCEGFHPHNQPFQVLKLAAFSLVLQLRNLAEATSHGHDGWLAHLLARDIELTPFVIFAETPSRAQQLSFAEALYSGFNQWYKNYHKLCHKYRVDENCGENWFFIWRET
ncbi:hypothetical protein HYFRA_00004983 [Hymenoscyphus fraxineus]|uniref:Fungal N-terminal domain-containing protein n=1 Tax=Hymenoscyphus fraxineus TaxID=746836 RepID=A0A9N9PPE3_9HELO|nr:hypothetical protein HYFRA_00004983 [Hymenoscyphus fraxineus]